MITHNDCLKTAFLIWSPRHPLSLSTSGKRSLTSRGLFSGNAGRPLLASRPPPFPSSSQRHYPSSCLVNVHRASSTFLWPLLISLSLLFYSSELAFNRELEFSTREPPWVCQISLPKLLWHCPTCVSRARHNSTHANYASLLNLSSSSSAVARSFMFTRDVRPDPPASIL